MSLVRLFASVARSINIQIFFLLLIFCDSMIFDAILNDASYQQFAEEEDYLNHLIMQHPSLYLIDTVENKQDL